MELGMENVQAILLQNLGFLPDWFIGLGLVWLAIIIALFAHRLAVATGEARDRTKAFACDSYLGGDIRTDEIGLMPCSRCPCAAARSVERPDARCARASFWCCQY